MRDSACTLRIGGKVTKKKFLDLCELIATVVEFSHECDGEKFIDAPTVCFYLLSERSDVSLWARDYNNEVKQVTDYLKENDFAYRLEVEAYPDEGEPPCCVWRDQTSEEHAEHCTHLTISGAAYVPTERMFDILNTTYRRAAASDIPEYIKLVKEELAKYSIPELRSLDICTDWRDQRIATLETTDDDTESQG